MLLRVDTNGNYQKFKVYDWTTGYEDWIAIWGLSLITNVDNGIILSWSNQEEPDFEKHYHMATASIDGVNMVAAPQVSGQDSLSVKPILQLQDGSFVGTANRWDDRSTIMVAFDATGAVRWTVTGYDPKIATADGGVIATDESGAAVIFDQSGSATGQIANWVESWTGRWYQLGSVDQIAVSTAPYYFAASFWAFQGGQLTKGTAGPPMDSIANQRARDIMTPKRWRDFGKSHCAAVFADPGQGIASQVANYSLTVAEQKQNLTLTNFYDIGNSGIGNLTRSQVTSQQVSSNQTLTAYLGNSNAATDNMGYYRQTAIVLKSGFFSQFTLMHEVLLHAYGAWWDDPIFDSPYFVSAGLWRAPGSKATTTISSWMSTDCTCTPENDANKGCKANTAKW